jgi:hypothetical protein
MTKKIIEVTECQLCSIFFEDYKDFKQHIKEYHPDMASMIPDLGD